MTVDAAGDGPLRENLRLALELARLPALRAPVVIRVVLERAAERTLEIPEVRRGNRMAPGTDVGFPAAAAHREAAAEHFVNVTDGKGDVIQAGPAGARENECIVMTARRSCAQKRGVPRIAVADHEPEPAHEEVQHR